MKRSLRLMALALAVTAPAFAQSKVENPVPVRTVMPKYPHDLMKDGSTGMVVVKCTIDVQGNVVEPEVAKTTNEAFNNAALDAIRKWKFKPAQQDGSPIAKSVTIPIKFVSEDET